MFVEYTAKSTATPPPEPEPGSFEDVVPPQPEPVQDEGSFEDVGTVFRDYLNKLMAGREDTSGDVGRGLRPGEHGRVESDLMPETIGSDGSLRADRVALPQQTQCQSGPSLVAPKPSLKESTPSIEEPTPSIEEPTLEAPIPSTSIFEPSTNILEPGKDSDEENLPQYPTGSP